jgi:hypothetical protein
MEYEQFYTEYERVVEAAITGLGLEALTVEVRRLRLLADGVVDLDDRGEAGHVVAMLERVLTLEPGPAPSAAVLAANEAYSRATASDGTAAERIARAEAGIEEIGRIARAADPDKQSDIRQMNESLYTLVGALKGTSWNYAP